MLRLRCCILLFCFSAGILLTLPRIGRAQGDGTALPVWKSDTSLQPHLASEKAFGTFGLRIPSGYILRKNAQDAGTTSVKEYEYHGLIRDDGTFPIFLVVVAPGHILTAQTLLDITEGTALKDPSKMVISPRQHGLVNGLSMIREYWKDATSKRTKVHGFFYSGMGDSGLISIMSMDAEPHHKATLALAEAAALTVRPLASAESVPLADDSSAPNGLPEAQSQGYALRLPPGFSPDAIPSSSKAGAGVIWMGTAIPGDFPPMLMLTTKQLKPSEMTQDAPLQFAMGIIVGLTHDLRGPIISSPQNVQIGDWPAVRLDWQGTKTLAGKSVTMHGFSYSFLDGSKLVMLLGMDDSSVALLGMPLMEAAAHSLHKK